MRLRKQLLAVLAALAALASAISTTSPAVATTIDREDGQSIERGDDLPDVAAPRIGDPIGEAELEDLTTFAEQSGISVEQAVADYGWRFDFSLLAQEIRESIPDDFAYAAATGPRTAELWFVGERPASAEDLVALFNSHFPQISVETRTNVGWSESEISAALVAAHFSVYEEVGDAASSFDHETLTIRVVVPSGTEVTDHMAERANESASESVKRALVGWSIEIEVSESERLSDKYSNSQHRGSEIVGNQAQTLQWCTTGPTFVKGSARRGSTAAHCGNTNYDDGSKLTQTHTHDSTWGDFQLHYGGQWESDDFYAGTASTTELNNRDTSSAGLPTAGQTLCTNGSNTSKSCDTVANTSICVGSNCYQIEMDHAYTAGGDSGGVVFYSNTVYGLTTGAWGPWYSKKTHHSRQDSVHGAFSGYYIATT